MDVEVHSLGKSAIGSWGRVSKLHTEKGRKVWKIGLTLKGSPKSGKGQDKEKIPQLHTPPELTKQQPTGRGQGKSSRKGRKKEKRDC